MTPSSVADGTTTTSGSSGVALTARATSGRDGDSQQLRCSDLHGNWLAVSSQAGDVNLDRLDGALPAFLDGAATGKAPRERRTLGGQSGASAVAVFAAGDHPAPAAAAETGGQPLAGYRSWEDCMLANGVLPACLLLLGIVFGLCLLAELASGYTLTPWLVALFWVYMGAETVALLNAINRCVYRYQ